MKRSNAHFSQHINYRDDAKKLRPCAFQKVRHLTRGAAEWAIKQRQTPGDPRKYDVAQCDSCGHWHVEVVGGVPPVPDFDLRLTRSPGVQKSRGQSLGLKPVSQCPRGKRRHHSVVEAEAEIERMKLYGDHRPEGGVLNVYECSACGSYHVGHKPGTAPAATIAGFRQRVR